MPAKRTPRKTNTKPAPSEALPPEPGEALPAAQWLDPRGLVPWSANYNQHPAAQLEALRASMRVAWTEAIVAREGCRTVVSGHGRLEAVLGLLEAEPGWVCPGAPGPALVPVRLVDVTQAEAEELAVAANEIGRLSVADTTQLGRIMETIASRKGARGEIADSLLRRVGMDRKRAEDLVRTTRAKVDPKKVPIPDVMELPEAPQSQVGEVYQLGPHRVLCGEALDMGNLSKVLEGVHADHVFTDPPYAIYGSSTGITSSIADDGMIRPFFRDVLRHAQAASRPFSLVWVCCDWRSFPSWWEVHKDTALQIKNVLIWYKGSGGLGNQYQHTYEQVIYAVNEPRQRAMNSAQQTGHRMVAGPNLFQTEDPTPREGEPAAYSDEVLTYSRVAGKARQHNAQKPVAMIEGCIRPAVRAGETVLDPFGGSGSTLLAAERLGLKARLVERSPGWVDVIRKRWTIFADDAGIEAGPGALR